MPGFRSNSIMAVDQKAKVCLVMDMSRPEGRSFNSNLTKDVLDKVSMSTAKQFGYSVREAGIGAIMSKLDMKDAYKLIPAKKANWKLQGMSWAQVLHRLKGHLRRHPLRHKLRCPCCHHPGHCHFKDRYSQEVGTQDPGRQPGRLAGPIRLDSRFH
jgi:hypothetical protein